MPISSSLHPTNGAHASSLCINHSRRSALARLSTGPPAHPAPSAHLHARLGRRHVERPHRLHSHLLDSRLLDGSHRGDADVVAYILLGSGLICWLSRS